MRVLHFRHQTHCSSKALIKSHQHTQTWLWNGSTAMLFMSRSRSSGLQWLSCVREHIQSTAEHIFTKNETLLVVLTAQMHDIPKVNYCVSTHAFVRFVVSTRLHCYSSSHTHAHKVGYKHFHCRRSSSMPNIHQLLPHVQLSLSSTMAQFEKQQMGLIRFMWNGLTADYSHLWQRAQSILLS